jgi:hypothetical protein
MSPMGPIATETLRPPHVRFHPESDRTADIAGRLNRANSRPCSRECDRSQNGNSYPQTFSFAWAKTARQLEFAKLFSVAFIRGLFPISFQLLLENLGSDALAGACKVVERQRSNDGNDIGIDCFKRKHSAGFEFA